MLHQLKRIAVRALATLVFMAMTGAQLPGQESLQEEFNFQYYQRATEDIARLTKTLERRKKEQPADGAGENEFTEEYRKKLLELQNDQKRFLDKLIELNPENVKYRFELARLTAAQGDQGQAMRMLKELAPLDGSGYPQAHFVLAQNYFNENAADEEERRRDLGIALKHIDQVLDRNKDHLNGKLLKARLLDKLKRHDDSYQLFETLFEKNPNYFLEMIDLNQRMGREERNRPLCEKALARLQLLAERADNQKDDRRWSALELGITKAFQKLDQHENAETRLEALINTAKPEGGPRLEFLQRLMADNYVTWADKVAASKTPLTPLAVQERMLDLYTKAYRSYPGHNVAKQSLATFSLSSNREIAKQARSVYDPIDDMDASASVLYQFGNHALISKKYSNAIRYLERAHEKLPRDPAILNNLAFAYLVASEEERNLERALKLVDEAILNLPEGTNAVERSNVLHTKATALEQLGRYQDAIEVYEQSLKGRPKHTDTVRALVECYQRLSKTAPEQYESMLKENDKQQRQQGGNQ